MHPSYLTNWMTWNQCQLPTFSAQASSIMAVTNNTGSMQRANITATIYRTFSTSDATDYQFTDGAKLNLFWGLGYLNGGIPNTTDTTKFTNGYTTVTVGPLVTKCPDVGKSGSSLISTFVALVASISAVAFFF